MAIITGLGSHLLLLCTMIYWQTAQHPKSLLNAQATQHAIGWQQLSNRTDQLLSQGNTKQVLADSFMTLSQLQYYSKQAQEIKVLSHPLNAKHGRQLQLELMGLVQSDHSNSPLLVVEHTALKLDQQIAFYQQTCHKLGGMKMIDSLDLFDGIKTFHFFTTGEGACQMPPIIYHENGTAISGWILKPVSQPAQIKYQSAINDSTYPVNINEAAVGDNVLFSSLSEKDSFHLLHFTIEGVKSADQPVQLMIRTAGHEILSHRLN